MEYAIIVEERGIGALNTDSKKNGYEKKNKKAKKAIDGENDELVLCSLMMDN